MVIKMSTSIQSLTKTEKGKIMKTTTRNVLFAMSAIAILAFIALYSMGDSSIMVDGEPVTGLAGAGFAFGGTLIGLFATVFGLVLVSLVLTGVSLFVVVVLALVFLLVVLMLSPLLLPLLLLAGLVWFFSRKKAVPVAPGN
jgi:hypothetical protein